jgi:hypothetical protein
VTWESERPIAKEPRARAPPRGASYDWLAKLVSVQDLDDVVRLHNLA